MLPKENRVDKKGIDLLFKEGKFVNSSVLTFKFIKNPKNSKIKDFQISFIAPKSVTKLAVKRNTLRRAGYAALAKHIQKFPVGITGAFIFKKYQDDVSILENEIKSIFNKIN